MFARRVSMQLKPNTTAEFTRKMETEVIPMLRKQKGFQDEITFVAAGGKALRNQPVGPVRERRDLQPRDLS